MEGRRHSTEIATTDLTTPNHFLDTQHLEGHPYHLALSKVVEDQVASLTGDREDLAWVAPLGKLNYIPTGLGSLAALLVVDTLHPVVEATHDSMSVEVGHCHIDHAAIPCIPLEDPSVDRLVRKGVVDIFQVGTFHDNRRAAAAPPWALPLCAASSPDQEVLQT